MKNGDACASPFLFYNFQMKLYKSILLRQSSQELFPPRRAPKLEYPVSATLTAFACANRSIPALLYAKVPSVAKIKNQNPSPPVSATPTHMLRICVNPLDGASLPKGLT
mgnify:CR=1 FL=1